MYVRAGVAAKELGVHSTYLKKVARQGLLPEGSVISTDGGKFSYDLELVKGWMHENFKALASVPKLRKRRTNTGSVEVSLREEIDD